MNCDEAASRLPELIYGDIDEPAALPLRRHLESCPSCREAQAALLNTAAALDAWAPLESTESAATVAAVAMLQGAAAPRRSLAGAILPWAGGIAAVLALLAGALLVFRGGPAPSDVDRQQLTTELSSLVRVEMGRERSITLDAIEGMLDEWEREQDRRYIALIQAIQSLRLEDGRRLEEVQALALGATEQARLTAGALGEVLDVFVRSGPLAPPDSHSNMESIP